MRVNLIIASTLLLTACVTPTVTQKPTTTIDFTRFKTVTYTVHPTPTTEYGSDMKYSKETISLFDTLLGKKLKDMGYVVAASGAPPDLDIDVAVTGVKEGNAALRFFVGFGAGRAIMVFDAVFRDSQGVQLAAFQGGRSYTGMEFGQAFAGNEDIQLMAATRSVNQIEEFMKNGGTFPSQNEKKAP